VKYQLEVGARTVDDVLAAERGGADRVELYSSPLEGALTPSAGLIQSAVEAVKHLKLFVMIRPRAGDFLYSRREFETMQRDVGIALEMGADGIMCGILDADGRLDVTRMRSLIAQCGERSFTLHRAFDFSRYPLETLEQAIDYDGRLHEIEHHWHAPKRVCYPDLEHIVERAGGPTYGRIGNSVSRFVDARILREVLLPLYRKTPELGVIRLTESQFIWE